MATRTQARLAVVEFLYALESGNDSIRKIAPALLKEKKIRNKQADFALGLFDGVAAHLRDVDDAFQQFLQSWDIKRLGMVDKSILRLGAYEILYSDVDLPVIINEAIEISKILGEENTPRFVNGILDAMGKQCRAKTQNNDSARNISNAALDSVHAEDSAHANDVKNSKDSMQDSAPTKDSKDFTHSTDSAESKVLKPRESRAAQNPKDSVDSVCIDRISKNSAEAIIEDSTSRTASKYPHKNDIDSTPKLCIALDLPSKRENLALCEKIATLKDVYVKVGLRSFVRDGADFVRELQGMGYKIILDLKLYDIPNTMLDTLYEIINLKVDALTIHASSGRVALSRIGEVLSQNLHAPLVFAVSALTSFNEKDFQECYHMPLKDSVLHFGALAHECGISGVVCSIQESKDMKDRFGLLTLCPGIRPVGSDFSEGVELYGDNDDQARVASISEAIKQKADFIVIGRPIYTHKDPLLLTKHILSTLKGE